MTWLSDAWKAGGAPWDEAKARTGAPMDTLARALFGHDPATGHLPAWDAPGAIDAPLRRAPKPGDGPTENAIKTALAKLLAPTRQVCMDTGNDALDAERASANLIHYIGLATHHL